MITLDLPPLRDRGRDVLLLAERFLARACADYGLPPKRLDARGPGAAARLRVAREHPRARECDRAGGAVRRLSRGDRRDAGARCRRRRRCQSGAPDGERWRGPRTRRCARSSWRRWRRWGEHLARGGASWASRATPSMRDWRSSACARITRTRRLEARNSPRRLPPARRRPRPRFDGSAGDLALLRADLRQTDSVDGWSPSSRALEGVIAKVHSFGGRVEELAPTGLVAAFGLDPVEDAPRRAAHAAMAIHKLAARAREANEQGARCQDRPARGSRSDRAWRSRGSRSTPEPSARTGRSSTSSCRPRAGRDRRESRGGAIPGAPVRARAGRRAGSGGQPLSAHGTGAAGARAVGRDDAVRGAARGARGLAGPIGHGEGWPRASGGGRRRARGGQVAPDLGVRPHSAPRRLARAGGGRRSPTARP